MRANYDTLLDPLDDDPNCLGDPWQCHCPRCQQEWCETRVEWAYEETKEQL